MNTQETMMNTTVAALRDGTYQVTLDGAEIVTVARDGADHDRHGNGIYTSAIYVATRRQSDGRLTWRRNGGYRCDRTSGKGITQPMKDRAKARAEDRGVPYILGIRHGTICE